MASECVGGGVPVLVGSPTGSSSGTLWFITGKASRNMTSKTRSTSMNGVVLISPIGAASGNGLRLGIVILLFACFCSALTHNNNVISYRNGDGNKLCGKASGLT